MRLGEACRNAMQRAGSAAGGAECTHGRNCREVQTAARRSSSTVMAAWLPMRHGRRVAASSPLYMVVRLYKVCRSAKRHGWPCREQWFDPAPRLMRARECIWRREFEGGASTTRSEPNDLNPLLTFSPVVWGPNSLNVGTRLARSCSH